MTNNNYYNQFKKANTEQVIPTQSMRMENNYRFSIIVPYRDNPYQNRQQQLEIFVPYMSDYLSQLGTNYDFQIIVVEQSQNDYKFNRGQLLNAGFCIAQDLGCDYHIFHDVDLLPDKNLLDYYSFYPVSPLHIAAVWDKYQHLDLFFGGVCSLTTEHFKLLNGYPNDFWGWGGEDEEIYHRIVEYDLTILKPVNGSFTELEHVHTKSFSNLVNDTRFDQIDQRSVKGKENGLTTLKIKQLYEPERLNHKASKYLVIL